MKYVIIVEPKLEKNFGKDKNGEDRVLTEDEDLIIQSLEQEVHQATQDIRINIGKYHDVDCRVDGIEDVEGYIDMPDQKYLNKEAT